MSRDVQLVKLGGSLITDKRTPETLRPDVLTRLAREVVEVAARIPEAVLLGHGSGSFGHHAAACSGLNAGPCDEEQLLGAARTQEQAAVLHGHVIRALHEAGGRPFPLAPSSFIDSDPDIGRTFGQFCSQANATMGLAAAVNLPQNTPRGRGLGNPGGGSNVNIG